VQNATTKDATPVNYATLGADVAAWIEEYSQSIGEGLGEGAGRDMLATLKANPWVALRWFVEDNIPGEQRAAMGGQPVEREEANEPLQPEWRGVDQGGIQ
jgi:hypothetical protein